MTDTQYKVLVLLAAVSLLALVLWFLWPMLWVSLALLLIWVLFNEREKVVLEVLDGEVVETRSVRSLLSTLISN